MLYCPADPSGGFDQHPELTVTSEERVLDAVLMWCMQADDIFGWETADELLLRSSEAHLFFKDRLPTFESLLHFVRFPLLPSATLEKVPLGLSSRLVLSAVPFQWRSYYPCVFVADREKLYLQSISRP